jgi:hypothetical protein
MLLFYASLVDMIEGTKMGDGCMPPHAPDCGSATRRA